jgi:hypothetical protein
VLGGAGVGWEGGELFLRVGFVFCCWGGRFNVGCTLCLPSPILAPIPQLSIHPRQEGQGIPKRLVKIEIETK